MSNYLDGFNDGIEAALKVIQEHRQAHNRVANAFYESERPDVVEGLQDWQYNDLMALVEKVKRLKRRAKGGNEMFTWPDWLLAILESISRVPLWVHAASIFFAGIIVALILL